MDNISSEIRTFVVENFLFGDAEGLPNDDASFLDLGIVDSTGVLELVTHLEDVYEIHVDDKEMIPENLDSVSVIAKYLEMKLGAQTGSAG